jgi:hypothetical protein
MTDRRRVREVNIWRDEDDVVIDFFGPATPARFTREDALCGVVLDEFLANALRMLLGEIDDG